DNSPYPRGMPPTENKQDSAANKAVLFCHPRNGSVLFSDNSKPDLILLILAQTVLLLRARSPNVNSGNKQMSPPKGRHTLLPKSASLKSTKPSNLLLNRIACF